MELDKWRQIHRAARKQFLDMETQHIFDRIQAIGRKNMTYFVEKGRLNRWYVTDQFRFTDQWAGRFKTKKAAQEWLARHGYTEAPMCKHGFFCDMGHSSHMHG